MDNAQDVTQRGEAISLPTRILVRKLLNAMVRPDLSQGAFANWLTRESRDHEFPRPVRIGRRACGWLEHEVVAWLATRPRGGVFSGRRGPKAV